MSVELSEADLYNLYNRSYDSHVRIEELELKMKFIFENMVMNEALKSGRKVT